MRADRPEVRGQGPAGQFGDGAGELNPRRPSSDHGESQQPPTLGLVAGGLGREWHAWYLVLIFLVAIAGGTVMTLAWGLLFKLMPPDERGAISGLATTTKGVGLVIGPLVAGGVIDLLSSRLEATDGYQALWPVLGVPILLAIPLVARLIRAESEADRAAALQAHPSANPPAV